MIYFIYNHKFYLPNSYTSHDNIFKIDNLKVITIISFEYERKLAYLFFHL